MFPTPFSAGVSVDYVKNAVINNLQNGINQKNAIAPSGVFTPTFLFSQVRGGKLEVVDDYGNCANVYFSASGAGVTGIAAVVQENSAPTVTYVAGAPAADQIGVTFAGNQITFTAHATMPGSVNVGLFPQFVGF